ncbi:hypothetical protein ZIOFF_043525 [Zingiber officinale]|uniref:GH16 domain-containing protein n=1 Tax=Zingiber officinale TaxID=94328 RepID=A0A8J5KU16_ZINOF|nr:hypothetical protein ZIOFF_043525 [Zingiber officinale]
MLHGDGQTVHLSLDQQIGAAFASQDLYLHGFFSASIKLPSDYMAGVVVAFYSLLRRDGLRNCPRITLQWGCRKRLHRIKVMDKGSAAKSGVRRGITSRNVRRIADQEFPPHPPLYPLRYLCGFSGAEKKVKFHGKVVRASLFGVGAPKALVIGVVALLVFDPKGLAEASSFFEQ